MEGRDGESGSDVWSAADLAIWLVLRSVRGRFAEAGDDLLAGGGVLQNKVSGFLSRSEQRD